MSEEATVVIIVVIIKDTQENGRLVEIISDGTCTIILKDGITCRTRNINELEEIKEESVHVKKIKEP